MENKKQVGGSSSSSSSSSSITMDLFGPKESSSSAQTGRFSSVFPPPSTVLGRDAGSMRRYNYGKHGTPENKKWDKNSNYQNQEVDHPCHLSSSIYYGGQDVYPPQPAWKPAQSPPVFKKDGEEDDKNDGTHPNSASRGNWWQGSLYY